MTSLPSRGRGLFPLPALQNFPLPCNSGSRRVQQRVARSSRAVSLANRASSALNSLHGAAPPPPLPPQTRNFLFDSSSSHLGLPGSTLRAVAHVQSCARRFVALTHPGLLCDDKSSLPSVAFSAAYAFASDAVPLVASRVALPSMPGTCELLDVLPPELALVYSTPNPELFRPLSEVVQTPCSFAVESPSEYLALVLRLRDLTMVSFTTTPKIVNGCFATEKSDGLLRFLFDGRPTNALWIPSPKVRLPGPDLLARLEVPEGGEGLCLQVRY